MRKVYVIVAFLSCMNLVVSQDCDCVYPTLFVHGWAGSELSWKNFSEEMDVLGEGIIVPTSETGSGTVFYAHLNYNHSSSAIWGENAAPDFPSYIDDDVIVHDQFYNAPTILPNKCSYAISFQTQKTIVNGQLVFENMTQWGDENYITEPSTESSSNQGAAFKQGYALGKAIKKVLELTGKEKVVLVAHSMGGLASREYLQRSSNGGSFRDWWVDPNASDGHKVAKLFTVGTPHRGSNVGNSALDDVDYSNLLLPLDVKSEAVRDLRYFFNTDSENEGVQNNGAYLFGNSEGLVQNDPLFYETDVDCNGTSAESVEGINNSGVSAGLEPWDGTYDNPVYALPKDIKYTYYVSDKLDLADLKLAKDFLSGAPDWLTWITPNIPFVASDGIVEADRQWIYLGGNGSTSDFVNGLSIPVPLMDYANSNLSRYVIADRITPVEGISHIQKGIQLPTGDINLFGAYLGASNYETNDMENLIRGVDEGDFPQFASRVLLDKVYKGYSQKRADIVANNSNAILSGSTQEDYNIDSDWFKFIVENSIVVSKILLQKPINQLIKIDVFDNLDISQFSNSQIVNPEYSITSDPNTETMELNLGVLTDGEYYIRITSQVDPNQYSVYNFSISQNNDTENVVNCFEVVYAEYTYECGGNQLSQTTGAQFFFNGRNCGNIDPNDDENGSGSGVGLTGGGSGGGPGNPGNSGSSTVSSGSTVPVITENDECNECTKAIQTQNAVIISRQNSNGN